METTCPIAPTPAEKLPVERPPQAVVHWILGVSLLLGIAADGLLRSVPFGINVSIFVGLLCVSLAWGWRRHKEPAPCWHVLALLFLLGTCGLIALPMGLLALHGFGFKSTRDCVMLTLPDGVHAIEHSRVRLPAICAEYSRDVTYITSGMRGKATPLRLDGCGGYPINCYLIETARGPLLHLDDRVSEHLLDMTTQTTYGVIRVQGKPYIGELRDERASSGWSIRNNDPSTLSVTIGDIEAKPMADLTQDATEVYLGRFGGGTGHLHFTPASESPEIAINPLIVR